MDSSFDAEKKRKMVSIIKELKLKIGELEKLRASPETRKSKGHEAKTLIEEIHVPALEALKQNQKIVH